MNYVEFFRQAFGRQDDALVPFDYQHRLAMQPWPDLLNVPTGMGKTAGVVLGWLWKRGWRSGARMETPDAQTPRRLTYCLPMRVLVEQTHQSICGWLERLGLLGRAGHGKVSVHLLMGGSEDLDTWAQHPEEDMVLIGTQDMLLSRALMRGYGMSRYRWPVDFALLHNDALWIFDEVQLMGAGLATSAQLEAFRRGFPLSCPTRSLWLSATLNPEWLTTVDMRPHVASLGVLSVSEKDRAQAGDRLRAQKAVIRAPLALTEDAGTRKGLQAYAQALCELVLTHHDKDAQTVVIVNRVDRAQELFRALGAQRPNRPDLLVHGRFRAAERSDQARRLREESSNDRIIVATQAIEAGVDISSKVLVTELAPWSSLVQRFGRCNRYGEHNGNGGARIAWVDVPDEAESLPYSAEELSDARRKLVQLAAASPEQLPVTDELRPNTPVLRRKDLLDLFNTDPDLSGFDVDVSDYIRDSGVPGLRVFWRDFDDPNAPEPQLAPQGNELCPISITLAKGLQRRGAWSWDSLTARWTPLTAHPRSGMTVLLRSAGGGYDPRLGFTAESKEAVPPVTAVAMAEERSLSDDWRSRQAKPILLTDHLAHVAEHAGRLCDALGQTVKRDAVVRAARWHDVGKLHQVFQETMHSCEKAPAEILAKSPCNGHHARRYFRHELASMLAWLNQHAHEPDADLIAYLVVAHHGKVRMSLRAMPDERPPRDGRPFARGIWEGDVLPSIDFDGEHSAETVLRLGMMELGEGEQGPSWTSRTLRLLGEHGPFRLAWLESLVRLADWRASAEEQS